MTEPVVKKEPATPRPPCHKAAFAAVAAQTGVKTEPGTWKVQVQPGRKLISLDSPPSLPKQHTPCKLQSGATSAKSSTEDQTEKANKAGVKSTDEKATTKKRLNDFAGALRSGLCDNDTKDRWLVLKDKKPSDPERQAYVTSMATAYRLGNFDSLKVRKTMEVRRSNTEGGSGRFISYKKLCDVKGEIVAASLIEQPNCIKQWMEGLDPIQN